MRALYKRLIYRLKNKGGKRMSSIALILALSAIIWYVIDRFKPIWSDKSWGKYVTTAAAGLLGAAVVFGYNLD